jgi:glycosyltransferase involved in cell wall biosynthesis
VNASSRSAGLSDVSVAIATYNGAAHLPALLDSILGQTVRPREIIAADDASTDETIGVLERYQRSSAVPFVIVRQAKNVGIIENFLAAFRAAKGELIAYCDQDDVWLDRKLEACAAAFDPPGAALVCHASLITDENLVETGEVFQKIAGDFRVRFPGVFARFDAWGHQMVFDRAALGVLFELYERDAFRKTPLGSCFDLGIPFAASLVGDLVVMREPLIRFRRHAKATTGTGRQKAGARGLRARIARRAARLIGRKAALESALLVLDSCPVKGARALRDSRRAYADALALAERRARLAETPGVFNRLAQAPGLARHAQRHNRAYRDLQMKDAVGDLITVVCGGARQ